ncbi:outer membrane beta-barrel protein [Hymenobacter sp. DG25B]|uniref:outer membrane beta-barrel protein n=1 Tax=Hymenobacter sp. DG25B TaxID=1385664 RepID=UPI00066283A5|nr:outer membrane beta-barrel protein [Hymenobacter sp. DG25B]
MKKQLMLLGGATLLTISASAQTEKGTVMLGLSGGNFGYSHNANSNGSNISASLSPSAGIFLLDNFLVGTRVNVDYSYFSQNTYTSTPITPYRYTHQGIGYGLGPFARYYVPSGSKHRFFAEAGVALYHSRFRAETKQQGEATVQQNSRNTYSGFHGAVGYNYFFTPNIALEATAGYYHTDLGQAYSGGNLRGQLGLSIFLQKRQPAAPQP